MEASGDDGQEDGGKDEGDEQGEDNEEEERQKKPPKNDVKWDSERKRWIDDDYVYNWDERRHDKRGGKSHWDRGRKGGGKGEWSPDGFHWYPK